MNATIGYDTGNGKDSTTGTILLIESVNGVTKRTQYTMPETAFTALQNGFDMGFKLPFMLFLIKTHMPELYYSIKITELPPVNSVGATANVFTSEEFDEHANNWRPIWLCKS